MEYHVIERGDPRYPAKLSQRLAEASPEYLWYSGPLGFLDRFTMAVICADSIGGVGLMETNQILFTVREFDMNYIGGWYSIMETEVFRLGLFRKNTTVTLFSAKGLNVEEYDSFLDDRFYPPLHEFPERDEYFARAEAGQLLMLSVADPDATRQVRKNIMARNWVSCALADVVFIPYGPRGTKTYATAKKIVQARIPAFTIDHEDSRDLHELGVPGFTRRTVSRFLEDHGAIAAPPGGEQTPERVLLPDGHTEGHKGIVPAKAVQQEFDFPAS